MNYGHRCCLKYMHHILRNNGILSVVNRAEHDPTKIGKGRNPLVSTKWGEIPTGKNGDPMILYV
jgi:hypothetical protein